MDGAGGRGEVFSDGGLGVGGPRGWSMAGGGRVPGWMEDAWMEGSCWMEGRRLDGGAGLGWRVRGWMEDAWMERGAVGLEGGCVGGWKGGDGEDGGGRDGEGLDGGFGFGSVRCGAWVLVRFGSVRYRFDAVGGKSIVETPMIFPITLLPEFRPRSR